MEKFDGFQSLADIMKQVVKDSVNYDGPLLDFGTIQADGSLKTNASGLSIPSGDYQICGNLTSQVCEGGTTANQGHSHGASTSYPQRVRRGSRVLVAWVGNDAVVIDTIHEASGVV